SIKSPKIEVAQTLQSMISDVDVKKIVNVWAKKHTYDGILFPTIEEYKCAQLEESKLRELASATAEAKYRAILDSGSVVEEKQKRSLLNMLRGEACKEHDSRKAETRVLKFRLTCARNGQHRFTSEDAAAYVGGKLQDLYFWVVDLSHPDLEFVLFIRNEAVSYGISLTKSSKHRRNIKYFGPMTLRATICAGMLRLAAPQLGDIVVDPMCGGGSIPIEATCTHPGIYCLCGDRSPAAVERTHNNIAQQEHIGSRLDTFTWTVTSLPLKDQSVDVFITDLPFGKRSGSVANNRVLYENILIEMARVVRSKTGRAVLLTADRRSMALALKITATTWRLERKLNVNVGGLEARVYLLHRKGTSVAPPSHPHKKKT
ncbi:hypothetical protein L9F63_023523, partial [Diploptera punctata]